MGGLLPPPCLTVCSRKHERNRTAGAGDRVHTGPWGLGESRVGSGVHVHVSWGVRTPQNYHCLHLAFYHLETESQGRPGEARVTSLPGSHLRLWERLGEAGVPRHPGAFWRCGSSGAPSQPLALQPTSAGTGGAHPDTTVPKVGFSSSPLSRGLGAAVPAPNGAPSSVEAAVLQMHSSRTPQHCSLWPSPTRWDWAGTGVQGEMPKAHTE